MLEQRLCIFAAGIQEIAHFGQCDLPILEERLSPEEAKEMFEDMENAAGRAKDAIHAH